MQTRAFARIAQNYAVRVSDFVRQPLFALNSFACARQYRQTNPHAPDTTNRQIPTHTIAQASSISAASNQHRWSMRREKDVQDTRR